MKHLRETELALEADSHFNKLVKTQQNRIQLQSYQPKAKPVDPVPHNEFGIKLVFQQQLTFKLKMAQTQKEELRLKQEIRNTQTLLSQVEHQVKQTESELKGNTDNSS